jgi:hypothetical protein
MKSSAHAHEFPTIGPSGRYGAILYVEKEGFLPLLSQAAFPGRATIWPSCPARAWARLRTLIASPPCSADQPPYTSPDLSTGDGTEAFYRYDTYEPGQVESGSTPFEDG